MKMRVGVLIAVAVFTFLGVAGVCGAAPLGAPPVMPSLGHRMVMIGPTDSAGNSKTMRGKLNVAAILPREIRPESVELLVDGISIGKPTKRPYKAEVDSTTLFDGDHTFKAVAWGAGGTQLWTATTKAKVDNSGKPDASSVKASSQQRPPAVLTPATLLPPAEMPKTPSSAAPEAQAIPESIPPPAAERAVAEVQPAPPAPAAQEAISTVIAQEKRKSFVSKKYGFSIEYPGSWLTRDESSKLKPKVPGGFWIVLGAKPVGKAGLVVNVHRIKLEPGTDADVFARYNDYVTKWERRTVLDAPAFSTTGGSPESKRVVHRTIIIKNGSAWMLNCIDTTGKPADESARLYESIVNSLSVK